MRRPASDRNARSSAFRANRCTIPQGPRGNDLVELAVDPGLWRGRRPRGSLECGACGASAAGSVKLQEVTE
jgi:hypothetical protein